MAIAGAGLLAMAIGPTGCGMPGPPQPPSLNLPKLVDDLTATRIGDTVKLRWTGPSENTDKTKVKPGMTTTICRRVELTGPCQQIGTVPNRPGESQEFDFNLRPEIFQSHVDVEVLGFEVEVKNARDRSAGASNEAYTSGGQGLLATVHLEAQNDPKGVQLQWRLADGGAIYRDFGGHGGGIGGRAKRPPVTLVFRITRTRLTSPPARSATATGKKSFEDTEAPVQILEVDPTLVFPPHWGTDPVAKTVDTHIQRDQRYSYTVQLVESKRVEMNNGSRLLEWYGEPSGAVEVETKDVFPPARPRGLAVVPVWGDDDKPGMDLSWEPNIEARLSGYRVYRAVDSGSGFGADELISGGDLITAPTFADRGLSPGTKYQYWVVAVDAAGNASERSASDREVALRSRN